MKLILVIIQTLFYFSVFSQSIILSRQVIGNYGGNHSTNEITIMDNVGEIMVTTENTGDLVVTQGFEQPTYNFKITRAYDCGELIDETANAFVPNSADQYSNKWIIDLFFYEQNSINTVTIFNRWGDVIKSIENYDNISAYWDGTNTNDQPMPSGTYFFTIEVPSEQIRCSNWVQIVKEN